MIDHNCEIWRSHSSLEDDSSHLGCSTILTSTYLTLQCCSNLQGLPDPEDGCNYLLANTAYHHKKNLILFIIMVPIIFVDTRCSSHKVKKKTLSISDSESNILFSNSCPTYHLTCLSYVSLNELFISLRARNFYAWLPQETSLFSRLPNWLTAPHNLLLKALESSFPQWKQTGYEAHLP